jgi:hypothetical protein
MLFARERDYRGGDFAASVGEETNVGIISGKRGETRDVLRISRTSEFRDFLDRTRP